MGNCAENKDFYIYWCDITQKWCSSQYYLLFLNVLNQLLYREWPPKKLGGRTSLISHLSHYRNVDKFFVPIVLGFSFNRIYYIKRKIEWNSGHTQTIHIEVKSCRSGRTMRRYKFYVNICVFLVFIRTSIMVKKKHFNFNENFIMKLI